MVVSHSGHPTFISSLESSTAIRSTWLSKNFPANFSNRLPHYWNRLSLIYPSEKAPPVAAPPCAPRALKSSCLVPHTLAREGVWHFLRMSDFIPRLIRRRTTLPSTCLPGLIPAVHPFLNFFSPTTISFGFFCFALGISDIPALSTGSSYIVRLSCALIILLLC